MKEYLFSNESNIKATFFRGVGAGGGGGGELNTCNDTQQAFS